jgi:hypothetical protein
VTRDELHARYRELVAGDQPATAVAPAERVPARGDPLLRELDAQRPAWRGKRTSLPPTVEGPRPPHRSHARGEPLDGAAAGPCRAAGPGRPRR